MDCGVEFMYQVCASVRMLGPNAGLFITLVSPSFPITDHAERASVARIVHELDTPPKKSGFAVC